MTPAKVRAAERLSRSRRSFMRAVGAGATALPFYKLLEDSFAHAAGEPLPLKLITISAPHGVSAEYWDNAGAQGIKFAFHALKAVVTGEPLTDRGDAKQHGKVSL